MKTIEVTYDVIGEALKTSFRAVGSPVVRSNVPADFEVVRVLDGGSAWVGDPLQHRRVFRILGCSMEWDEVPEGAYAPQFIVEHTVYDSLATARKDEDDPA